MVEALVVIAIITVLLTLLLPALGAAKRRAKITVCMSRINQQSIGLTSWATDSSGRYPPHYNWAPDVVWAINSIHSDMGDFIGVDDRIVDRYDFLDRFYEYVGGNSADVLWCPFDRDLRPGPASPWYGCPTDCDPRYGDAFNYPIGGRHHQMYWIGYVRLAAWRSDIADWSQSGYLDPTGPVMRPAGSDAVILADLVMSEGDTSTGINNHADNPRDNTTHRENNVGYSDLHVETHYHSFTEPGPPAHWTEHYVRYNHSPFGSFWLY